MTQNYCLWLTASMTCINPSYDLFREGCDGGYSLTTTVRPVEQVHALAAGPRKLVDMQLVIALVGFTRVPKVAGNY